MGLFNSVGQMLDDRPGSPIEDWLRQNDFIGQQTPRNGLPARISLFQSAPQPRGLFATRPSADRLGDSGGEIGSIDLLGALAEADRHARTIGIQASSSDLNRSVQDFTLRANGPKAYGQKASLQSPRIDAPASVADPARTAAASRPDTVTSRAAQVHPTAARIRADEAAANRRIARTGRPGRIAADALDAGTPQPVAEQPLGGQANQPPAPYRSQVDPAKNAQLQAAFDNGASVGDLLKMAFSLGIQFDRGNTANLRQAIAWRDKGGKGARIAPEAGKESLDRAGRARLVGSPVAGIAFNDELPETVASKLKPEQLARYLDMATDLKSTPEQLTALMKSFGHELANADAIVEARAKGLGVNKDPDYRLRKIPKNPDGAGGAAARGFGDPINLLDEMGAVADTLGATSGRENIWTSDRPFLDVLNSNIDENRSILQADERDHFEARFGGQLASGLLIPVGGGARTAGQFAKYGAAEGFAAGFGAGEGNPLQRAPNAAVGAGLGFAGGYSLGRVGEEVLPLVPRALRKREDGLEAWLSVADEMEPIVPQRGAATLNEARTAAKAFVGRPIRNEWTDLDGTVSNKSLGKMTSAKAFEKSIGPEEHAAAVANADQLFAIARRVETHPDNREELTIKALHRYIAPMMFKGRRLDVKLTVKETTGPNEPNPLYTIEAVRVEPASVPGLRLPRPDKTGTWPPRAPRDL
jgi:hypothetical protein